VLCERTSILAPIARLSEAKSLPVVADQLGNVRLKYQLLVLLALGRFEGCERSVVVDIWSCRFGSAWAEIDRPRNDVAAVTRVLGELADNLIDVKRYGDAERYAREALDLARRHHLDFEIVINFYLFVRIAIVRSTQASADALDGCANAARVLGYADARLALIGSLRTVDLQTNYEIALTALRWVFGCRPPRGADGRRRGDE
jgi:hypothetical protein